MHGDERISIWFFIGGVLFIYGILICGTGVYELWNPPGQKVVLGELHASVWWGALLIVLGAVYCWQFFPGRRQKRAEEAAKTAAAKATEPSRDAG